MLNKRNSKQVMAIIGGILRDQWHAFQMQVCSSSVVSYKQMVGVVLTQGYLVPRDFRTQTEIVQFQIVKNAMQKLANENDEVVQMKSGCKWINV